MFTKFQDKISHKMKHISGFLCTESKGKSLHLLPKAPVKSQAGVRAWSVWLNVSRVGEGREQ